MDLEDCAALVRSLAPKGMPLRDLGGLPPRQNLVAERPA